MVTDTFDVVLLGFEEGAAAGGTDPVEAMQRLFQIDGDTARELVASAPVTVKHGATQDVAMVFQQGLRSIGARVAIRPVTPAPVRRPSARPRAAQATPAPAQAAADEKPQRGFFASLPAALLLPLRGTGFGWLAAAAGIGFVGVVGGLVPLFGLVVQIVVLAALLTVLAKYFQACMAAAAMDLDRPQGFPEVTQFFSELVLPGLALTLWFVAANLPLLFWLWRWSDLLDKGAFGAVANPVTLALAAFPYVLWPAALARGAARGSFFSMFNLPAVVIGVMRAPLAYATVLGLGVAATLVPLALASFQSQACGGFVRNLVIYVVDLAIFAYAHGVMGAAMGHLARVKPAVVGNEP
jgi:hypothetical protein